MSSTSVRTNGSKSGHARMATQQEKFRLNISERFRTIEQAVSETVVENDALRIGEDRDDGPNGPRDLLNVDPVDDFEFTTDSARQEAVNNWFEGAIEQGLINPLSMDDVENGEHWTGTYIDESYEKGVRYANGRLRDAGIDPGESGVEGVMNLPAHREGLQTVYTRTYRQLEGIGEAAEQDISRVISEELSAGHGPREMGRRLTDEISSIEGQRGVTLARTETMNAHAYGGGTQFIEMGVERVDILTSDPCDQCASYAADAPHDVQEAIAALPLHPNCVCNMTPYVES